MYAPLPSAHLPAEALVISAGEPAVRMDMHALRGAGVHSLTHKNTLDEALAWLAGRRPANGANAVDIVICSGDLRDASAADFLLALSHSPALRTQPVLVIAVDAASANAFRRAGLPAVERPYSLAVLTQMLHKALSPARRPLASEQIGRLAASAAEVRAVKEKKRRAPKPAPLTVSDYFNAAVQHLRAGELDQAAKGFRDVLSRKPDHVDAELGLAKVYHARNDALQTQAALVRASAACLRRGEKARAAGISALLPAGMRSNIFVHEAYHHLLDTEYGLAAQSFLDAGRENPNIPLHRVIARTCLLTEQPETAMRKTCDALDRRGHKNLATALRRRLLEYAEYEPSGYASWLDKYPRLKDTVEVVSMTARAWKEA